MKHIQLILLAFVLMIPVASVAQDVPGVNDEAIPAIAGDGQESPQEAADAAHVDAEHAEGSADAEHGEDHAPATFLGLPVWIWNLVNLFLFFGLLGWLLKGPIGRTFAERRKGIQTALAEAEARRKKSDSIAADIQSRLEQIETEVAAILARAREEGERQRAEMIEAGELEAKKILAQARAEVEARTKASRQELTELARELSVERAGRLLEQSITDEDRKRLFREGVDEIAEVQS